MFLLVEAVADYAVWAPVKLAADNPSRAFDEAELRFRGWKNCRVSKLYHMDNEGNMKLIHDFVNEHPVFQGQQPELSDPGGEMSNPFIPPVRRVPAKLYRSPSGRLHLYNQCSGGASPATARVVVLSQADFEKAVYDGNACRCVNAYKRAG